MSVPEPDRGAALLAWYRDHRRDLPWRDVADPYLILVSEVMLQQTQATRVVAFYERFVAQFPTVDHLAAAPPAEVLALWSGLGYNSRAVRLQAAAAFVADHGWPDTVKDLLALPGVGPYTAAAIAACAFGRQVAAPDTNARRVLSRWRGTAIEGATLFHAAEEALAASGANAADWNQALMELGAQVCMPRAPHCWQCPVERWCAGPAAYRPPPRQAAFEGSLRQTRGAVVKALLSGAERSAAELARELGHDHSRVQEAVLRLTAEGLLSEVDGRIGLVGGRSQPR